MAYPVSHKLVIVESPAKARNIGGFLGDGYVVESSIGHIRDLPMSAADTPAEIKDKPWGRLAVDVENGFTPYYIVPRDKREHMRKLKKLLKDADELYLATDEDREGEAIAWHLLDELKPKAGIPVHRMVFHEITKPAIQAAVANPRSINDDLVEAQEARRILDRLYGYEVSPVLWKKVMSGLSAGRVQSVATRLVVDRERERIRFRVASYWDLEGTFDAGSGHEARMFPARVHSVDGDRVARGSDFGQDGVLKAAAQGKVVHLDRTRAEALVAGLSETAYTVRSVEAKPYRRSPYAPFRTTTLQQEASRKLGMGASVTMSVAQRLYENGFITYMRTDSTTLSGAAIDAARSQVRELYGSEYVPDAPRVYATKVKNAQEAHEAIRPAGETFRTPAQTGLTGEQFRLYELIWMRTVASQMKDATGQSVSVRLGGAAATGEDVVFAASGRVITFHGFLKAYVEGTDHGADSDDKESRLPQLSEGEPVSAASLTAGGHETKPPARYTEATLVKELEERLIGRPSTYASIMKTIVDRGYVYKKGTALVPAWLAFSVTRLLEEHFPRQVSYEFTAAMEDVLDDIAGGRKDRNTELSEFYYGAGEVTGLKRLVDELGDIDARELATFPIGGPESGINLRVGRYGPYLEGPDDEGNPLGKRANVPDDLPPDELTLEKATRALRQPRRRGDPARRAPRDRSGGGGQERPLRPLRHRAAARRRSEVGPPAYRVAVQVDDPRHDHPRRRRQAALAPAGGRRRRGRRGDHRAERSVRAVPEEGHRLPLAGGRGAAADDHPRRGPGDLRPAQAARSRRGRPAAEGARHRSGLRPADRGQGRPLRRVRHRRRVQRHPAQGGLGRVDHPRPRRRAARRAPGPGPGEEDREEGRQEDGQEGSGQEGHREEGHRPRRPPPRRPRRRRAEPGVAGNPRLAGDSRCCRGL